MKNKKGSKGSMTIKIDPEKAYDRLKWDFIVETLTDIGFPNNFIDKVGFCISSSKMQVMWNRKALESFKPSREIRQGDQISPYLFLLCIERLFHLIILFVEHSE